MADWDPLAFDEGPGESAPAPPPVEEGGDDGFRVVRLKKEDVDTLSGLILDRLGTEEPWKIAPNPAPDLTWYTPTCGPWDPWLHHDVQMEVGTGIVYVIFNRGNENNTMQDTLGSGINDALFFLHARKDIRVAVWTGQGRMYCAGGDPKGWQAFAAAAASGEYTGDGTVGVRIPMKPSTDEVNWANHMLGTRALKAGAFPDGVPNIGRLHAAKQWHTWATLPQFTICLANGSAMGGGVGCVCGCDYVISVKKAYFVLSEVKIGVIPATISPYVIAKIGTSNAKRFFCAAENLSAQRAKEYGIVNEVVENMREGHERVQAICKLISQCGPRAVQLCKEMLVSLAGQPLGEGMSNWTAYLQAGVFESEEGHTGMACKDAKKDAPWISEPIGFDVWPTVGVGEGKKKKAA